MRNPIRGLGKALTATPQALDALRSMGGTFFAFPRSAYVEGAFYKTQAASYGHMYRTQPNVRIVVDAIARVAADRSLKFYRWQGEDKVDASTHPAAASMRQPNDWQGTKAFLAELIRDWLIYDDAYAIRMGPWEGEQVFLVRVPPHAMGVNDKGGKLRPSGYRLTFADGTYLDLKREEVIHFHGYSPSGSALGTSPMETLRTTLVEEATRQARTIDFVKGGLVKGGIIERPPEAADWSGEAMERFSEWFSARLRGTIAGQTPVLEEGMHFVEAGVTPEEAQMLENRKFSLDLVALTFGVNPGYFTSGDQLTAARDAMEEDVVTPLLGKAAEALTFQFALAMYGAKGYFFKFRPRRETDITKLFDASSKGTGGSVMTPNEFRAEFLDLPPHPDGDELAMHPGAQSGALPPGPGEEDRGRPEEDDVEKALEADLARIKAATERAKAEEDAPRRDRAEKAQRRRDRYAAEHAELLRDHFRRQMDVEGTKALDSARWDQELADDLYALAVTTVAAEGEIAAARLGGFFDSPRTKSYLKRGAEITAQRVNRASADAVKASDADDPVNEVLTKAVSERADAVAGSRATALMGFAVAEAARQNPSPTGRSKTWVASGLANSRHADLDGETVPIDEAFSNGMMYPGDPSGGADETAGCQCTLEVA